MKKILYWIVALSITAVAIWQTWPSQTHIFGANQKISELSSYTTPLTADVLPINDTANATTKQITVGNLFNALSSVFRIKDSTDTSKKVAFDASGITTATTRTLTVPDANGTLPLGTGTTNRLTFWSGTNALSSNAAFVVDTSLSQLTSTNLVFTAATGTRATTTSFFATTASSTSLFGAGLSSCTGSNFLQWTGGSFSCTTVSTGSSIKSTIPRPEAPLNPNTANGDIITTQTVGTNTTMWVGRVFVPSTISVNRILFNDNGIGTTGSVKIGLYSEDGQTLVISTSTAVATSGFQNATTTSPTSVSAGVYYVAIVPVGTTSFTGIFYKTKAYSIINPAAGSGGLPVYEGTVTVSAGTLPATITPASITYGIGSTLIFRLEN